MEVLRSSPSQAQSLSLLPSELSRPAESVDAPTPAGTSLMRAWVRRQAQHAVYIKKRTCDTQPLTLFPSV